MGMVITQAMLNMILMHPHVLGLIVGFKDLTEQHSEWIRIVWAQPAGKHTGLQAHRGAYKTTAVTIIGIVWYLLWNPNARICLLRETYSTACDTLNAVRKVMNHPIIREIFRAVHGAYPVAVEDNESVLDFSFKTSISKEPSISAFGILQLPTGSHFDFILCDDIVTLNSKMSKAQREKINYCFREVLTNIIDPGKTVGHVGTPWHKKDAWQYTVPPFKADIYSTGIMSEAQIAQKRASTTASDWAINMELRFVADGEKPFSSPAAWAPFPRNKGKVLAHLDAKYGGTDTMALTHMVKLDRRVHITGKIYTTHVMDTLEAIIQELVHMNARQLYLESNGDKGLLASEFRRLFRLKKIPIEVVEYHEKVNKHIKIVGVGKPVWPYLVWDNACDSDYLEQTNDYCEGNEPDDGPDSWTSLIREGYGEDNAEWRFLYSQGDGDED